MMKTRYYHRLLRLVLSVGCWLLVAACSNDVASDEQEPLPEGMGRIRVTLCTPETAQTRAVNAIPWEDPDHEWERLQNFRILICTASTDGKYEVVQVISGTGSQLTEVAHTGEDNVGTPNSMSSTHKSGTFTSAPLTANTYYIFVVANFTDDEYAANYAVGKRIDPEATVKFSNGYSEANIPMTGRLTTAPNSTEMKRVIVNAGSETDAGTITVWRVMGKMQFYFTNESDRPIRIIGIEVEPINLASSDGPGIYLFSKDNLESINNLAPGETSSTGEVIHLPNGARTDVGTVKYQPTTIPLTLAAKNDDDNTDEGSLFFYVNESDATFTTTNNQLSLRFKVQRQKPGTTGDNSDDWYDEEIRYGVTTHYGDGTTGQDGFNVIRRNDWIHIPVVLTDWQFRIEPLAFVPIAGYPAKTLSSDGLTATFSTGGMIALQPFIKKYDDTSWRGFGDPEITYGNDSWAASIHWKNKDGDDASGDTKIVKTAFAYDPVTKCIIGELNNAPASELDAGSGNHMTTFTVCLRLGPKDDTTKQYTYTFTFNVILKK